MIDSFAFTGVFFGLFILVIIAILIFEIAMLVDVIRNKAISGNTKLLWVIGMLLIHPIVAIIYLFTDYKKGHR